MKALAAILALAGLLALAAPPAFAQGWTGVQTGHITTWSGPSGQSVSCVQVGHITTCN